LAQRSYGQEVIVNDREVRVTNPERVLVDGVTKADALRYFLAVGDGVVNALNERPVMLERRRDGDVFFQRRVPKGAPAWVPTVRGPEYDMVCPDDVAVVAWMVNLGAVTFHPWPVRREHMSEPDRILIDLDPQSGCGYPEAAAVARVVRDVLGERGLEGFPKTSGGRGLHVIAPIEPRPWADVQATREAIGREVVERLPELATMKRLKRDRGARVYVDCGPQTVASAYSIRPGGYVSAPLRWEELDDVSPQDFDVDSMPRRFAAVGDLSP
jgi:DNA ligase D-like protein (predicted polymerase)